MNIEQFCQKYQISNIDSFKKNYQRQVKKIEQEYGIKIRKVGVGKDARYIEIVDGMIDQVRLNNQIIIDRTDFKQLNNWTLLVLLTLLAAGGSYKGFFQTFLQVMQQQVNTRNINKVAAALQQLKQRKIVVWGEDQGKPHYFFAMCSYNVMIGFTVYMHRVAQARALVGSVKEYIDLFKVWYSLWSIMEERGDQGQIIVNNQDIREICGMSDYLIRKNLQILIKNNIVSSKLVYRVGEKICCLGKQIKKISAEN